MASSSESAAGLEGSESSIPSVQELMIKNPDKLTVPQCFLRADQEPPNFSNGGTHHFPSIPIPTIDLEYLLSEEDTSSQLDNLRAICKKWGIFQVIDINFFVKIKVKAQINNY